MQIGEPGGEQEERRAPRRRGRRASATADQPKKSDGRRVVVPAGWAAACRPTRPTRDRADGPRRCGSAAHAGCPTYGNKIVSFAACCLPRRSGASSEPTSAPVPRTPRAPGSSGSCRRGVCVPRRREDVASLVRTGRPRTAWRWCRVAPGSAMGGGNVGDGVVVDLTGLPAAGGRRRRRAPRARAAPASRSASSTRPPIAAGLRLPPDPSSGRWATLGRHAVHQCRRRAHRRDTAACGAGSRAPSMVTADGEVARAPPRRARPPAARSRSTASRPRPRPPLRAAADLVRARFPRTRKNSSGYALDAWLDSGDLLDLVIGAEGTLGIVTAVEWRLDPVPRTRRLRVPPRAPSLTLADAGGSAARARGHPPCELLDRTFLEVVRRDVPVPERRRCCWSRSSGTIRVGARGRRARPRAAVAPRAVGVDAAASPRRRPSGSGHCATRRARSSPGSRTTRRSLQVIEDGCVPVERMGDYMRAVREAAAERGLAVVIFGHAGDGHVHVNLLPDIGRAGLGGVGRRAARGRSPTARPARRHAVGRAWRRPAPRRPAGAGLRRRGRGAVRAGSSVLRPAGHPESRRYPSRRRRRRRARSAASRSASRTRRHCRTTSRAASDASSSTVATPRPGSSWPTAPPLTPDPTTHGHPSRRPGSPSSPARSSWSPRTCRSQWKGDFHRRRADRRVRRPALLHEPAQPGRPDHGRVPAEHPEAGARLGLRALRPTSCCIEGISRSLQPRAGAAPGGLRATRSSPSGTWTSRTPPS